MIFAFECGPQIVPIGGMRVMFVRNGVVAPLSKQRRTLTMLLATAAMLGASGGPTRAGDEASRDACRNALDEARAHRLERIDPSYLIKNKPVAPPRRARKKKAKGQQLVTPQDSSSSR